MSGELTEVEQAMLDFEERPWSLRGSKESAIRETFNLTPTKYYQQLNQLINKPAALRYAGPLVNRLRRLRQAAPRNKIRGAWNE